jgi:hypothetical protein
MRDYKQQTVKEWPTPPPPRKDMKKTLANFLTVALIIAIGYLGYQWLIETPQEGSTAPMVDVNKERIIPLQLPPLKPVAPPPPTAPPVNLVPAER